MFFVCYSIALEFYSMTTLEKKIIAIFKQINNNSD